MNNGQPMAISIQEKSSIAWLDPQASRQDISGNLNTKPKLHSRPGFPSKTPSKFPQPKVSYQWKKQHWNHLKDGSRQENGDWNTLVWKGYNGHLYFEPLRCKTLLTSDGHSAADSKPREATTKLPSVNRSAHVKYSLETSLSLKNRGLPGSLVVMGDGRSNGLKRTGNFMFSNDFRRKVFKGIVRKSPGIRDRSPPWGGLSKEAMLECSKTSPLDKTRLPKTSNCTYKQQLRVTKDRSLYELKDSRSRNIYKQIIDSSKADGNLPDLQEHPSETKSVTLDSVDVNALEAVDMDCLSMRQSSEY